MKNEFSATKADLTERRTALVSKTTTLLSLYHLATTLVILILEQNIHGSIARHIKAHSELLSLSAQTLQYQVQEKAVRGEKMVYTEDVKGALDVYVRNLTDGRERLRERRGAAEKVLWGYGVGREGEKERVMREVARVYGGFVREIGEVGGDVERLRGR